MCVASPTQTLIACILILEHGTTNGSYGIAVNKPSEHSLGTAVKNLPSELDMFASNPVSFGGMIRRLQCMYACTIVIN